MSKQREAEQKVKDAEREKREEEERQQAEDDNKFGNRVKAGFSNVGSGFKSLFQKTDDKISQSVDGKHKSNGGVSPRGATSPRDNNNNNGSKN